MLKVLPSELEWGHPFSGEKDIPELELTHLEGHKQSRPVRIGNGAADHVQLVRLCYIHTFSFRGAFLLIHCGVILTMIWFEIGHIWRIVRSTIPGQN